MSFEDRMKMAIDFVYQKKYNSNVERLIKSAKFRMTNASFNDIYYIERGLDKEQLLNLSTAQFIDMITNIIFHGFTGSGKSYYACALGKQACMQGIRTYYIRIPDLLMLRDEATLTPQDISKLLKKFTNYKLFLMNGYSMIFRRKNNTFFSN